MRAIDMARGKTISGFHPDAPRKARSSPERKVCHRSRLPEIDRQKSLRAAMDEAHQWKIPIFSWERAWQTQEA